MKKDGHDLVAKLHREAGESYREQKRKERELVEAFFRAALDREREQQAKEQESNQQIHRQALEYAPRNPLLSVEPPRGVPYTELPEAKSGEPLAEEWNTYRPEVGRLLAEGQEGRYVLIKGGILSASLTAPMLPMRQECSALCRSRSSHMPFVSKSPTFASAESTILGPAHVPCKPRRLGAASVDWSAWPDDRRPGCGGNASSAAERQFTVEY